MTGTSGPGPDDQPSPSAPEFPHAPDYPLAPEYPAYAGGPGGPGGPDDRAPQAGPMPPTVHWASILLIVRAGLGVVSALIFFGRIDKIIDDAVARTPTLDRDSARAAIVYIAVISLIISVLMVGLALMLRRGRNWARITAIVLAVLGILGGLGQFAQSYGGAIVAVDVVSLLLAVATLALLLMPASSEYFKASRPGM
ncbi:MAG: hypothetical protein V7637_4688 [Mycobacteriales bacterium]